MAGRLDGKVIAVTGGESGIGRAIALRCVREGASVMIAGIQDDLLPAVVKECKGPGKLAATRCDVTRKDQVDAMIDHTVRSFGRLDAAVANAGAFNDATAFVDYTLEEWHRVVGVNLTGVFLTLQAAARALLKQGGGGSLIATGSSTALRPNPMHVPYVASKGGVHLLMRALAIELAPHKIRCNTIVPGLTETAAATRNPGYIEQGLKIIPMGEIVQPEEIAAIVAFALSDEVPHMTGTLLKVDSGRTSA